MEDAPIPREILERAAYDLKARLCLAALNLLAETGMSLSRLASRSGIGRGRLREIFSNPSALNSLGEVSDLFLAFGVELDMRLQRLGQIAPRKPRFERFWTPRQKNVRWRPRETMASPIALAWTA